MKSLSSDIILYKIQQVDYDVRSSFSDILPVRIQRSEDYVVQPNFINEGDFIDLTGPAIGKVIIYIVDGKLVQELSFSGERKVAIPYRSLSAGSYFMMVNGKSTVKFVLVE